MNDHESDRLRFLTWIEVATDCIANLHTQFVKGVGFRENRCTKRHGRVATFWRFSDFED